MCQFMKLAGISLLIAFTTACATYTPVEMNEVRFSAAEVEEDLDSFLYFVNTTHPDLNYSADTGEIDITATKIRQSLRDGMTLREAWMEVALLNPVFADAHIGLRRPVAALSDYQDQGGTLFPVPIVIDEAGTVRVASSAPAEMGLGAGDAVLTINGISTKKIVDDLAPRMRGETERLRRLVMELYFPEYFWIAYGGYDRYVIRTQGDRGAKIIRLPHAMAGSIRDKAPDHFTYRKIDDQAGYLGISTFNIAHLDAFKSFLPKAFEAIEADGVEALIIDLRENTGGARDLSDLLMAYLTDKQYSAISHVTARVTEENIRLIPGAKLGDVVTIPFQQTVTPPGDLPFRFAGDVYLLIGALTYSQAIVFAATVQDHGIGKIAGEETEGPANQTGQVQQFVLPNTGVEALAPIYIFTRASGDNERRGVIPDIEIEDDPLNPDGSVAHLRELIARTVDSSD